MSQTEPLPDQSATEAFGDNSGHDTDCDCKACLIDTWNAEVEHLRAECVDLVEKLARVRAWANQYEAALLAVRTEAKVGRAAWLLSNDTFEHVRRALEDSPIAFDEERAK